MRAFWDLARFHARLNVVPSYFGPTTLEVVPPPTWSFGRDEEAARLTAELLDGTRTALDSPQADYEATGEPLPTAGALSILLDEADRPVALLEVTAVETSGSTLTEHLRVVYRGG